MSDTPEPTANPFKLAARWMRHKSVVLEHNTHQLQEATKTPKSWVEKHSSNTRDRWQDRQAVRQELEMYRNIRVDGGIIATLLEVRSLMVFGVGGEWQAEDDDMADWLNKNLPGTDTLLHDIGLDTYTYGYALAEVVETKGGDFGKLVFLEPWTTTPTVSGKGEIQQWTQEVKRRGGSTKEQVFQPKELMHFKTLKRSARDEVGMSLLGRALDEAEAFRDDQRSIRNAVKLYGFPKLHAKLGREGGAVIDDNELRRARPMFQDIDEETLWVTGQDVDIAFKQPSNFDFTGITEQDLAKLAIVFMLPLEITQLGGGEGLGTGFPAQVRQVMFKFSARAHQKMLSNQLRDQVAHTLLTRYGGFSEAEVKAAGIRFVFNDLVTDMDQVKAKVEAVGSDMTVDERRGMFDLAPIEDSEVGEQFIPPGKVDGVGGIDDPFGGIDLPSDDEPSEEGDDDMPAKGTELQEQALNGAQINAVLDIIAKFTDGDLDRPSTVNIILNSFPFLSREMVEEMVPTSRIPEDATVNPPKATMSSAEPVTRALQESGISTEVLAWISDYARHSQGSVDHPVDSFLAWLDEFADDPANAVQRATVAISLFAAAQGVTLDQAREQPVSNVVRFLERHRNLAQGGQGDEDPFDWESHIEYMSEKVAWGQDDRALFGFSEDATPEFVKAMMLEAINDSDEIFRDLETLSASATRDFRNYMAGELSSDGWTISEMKNELQRLFNVTEQESEVLARSTTQNVISNAAENGYRQRDDFEDLRFKWSGMPYDPNRSSEVCQNIEDRVNDDPVPLDELKEIVQEEAKELGLKPRGWTPHPQCTHRPMRVVN